MTALNKQALRINAQLASSGKWIKESGDGWEAICSSDDQANAGFIIAHFEGPDAKANREFSQGANPATVLALLDEIEKLEKVSEARKQALLRAHKMFQRQRDRAVAAEKRITELLSENAGLKNSVENAAGCINAAYAEGLIDVLSESSDERLVDLVKRRLLFAYLPVETPATNEELIAMGDWVLREQLEDGTRAIKTLNRRIAELEARTITVKFEPIPMEELGNHRDGKKHPYMFGAGYNSAVVHCESVLHQACDAAGIGVKGG
ncbi:ead/Ea22-like family protein [Salmonella enterica subsp. enterica serovar Elokate]|nr:ead/Ea22-like family protein [Salmonella enterica subsp. enterica serovar Elokate]